MTNDKKVVLVNPPFKFTETEYSIPPLGLLYLAANLKKNNIPVVILDYSVKSCSLDLAVKEILSFKPDFVGISVMTDKIETSLYLSKEIKLKLPYTRVILGGPHINATGADVMSALDLGAYVDAVLDKESEETIVQYVTGEDKENIPGLSYRDEDGNIRSSPSQIPNFNLDDLPFPDLKSIVKIPSYHSAFLKGGPVMTMMVSRGCPFICKFCDVHRNMGRKYRVRSPENIVEEIVFHKKRSSVNNIIFKDSIFNLNKKNTIEFCGLLLKKNIKINWMCNSRVNTIDYELAKLMHKAGCKNISFGVESLAPEVLDQMRKKNVISEIHECFKMCRAVGINTIAYMMIGCEGETYQINMASLDELIILNPTLAEFNITKLYPGTDLYKEALEKGILRDEKWYYSLQEHENDKGHLTLNYFPIEEQIKAGNESYKRFYFRFSKIIEIVQRYLSVHLIKMGMHFLLLKGSRHKF